MIDYLRAHDGAPFPVVLADLRPAYTMSGRASVYVVAVNEGHMRAEPKIDPPRRRADVNRFLDPATSEAVRDEIMRRYDVRYAIVEEDSPVAGARCGPIRSCARCTPTGRTRSPTNGSSSSAGADFRHIRGASGGPESLC